MIISLLILIAVLFSGFIPRNLLRFYFFIIAFWLSFIAFFYIPESNADLFQHFMKLEYWRTYGWNGFNISLRYKNENVLWLWNIYSFMISLLKFNGFLPAISVFIGYSCVFEALIGTAKKYKIKKKFVIIAFFFVLTTFNYLEILGGIRNMLAYSIFAYCIYIELIEEKNKFFVWGMYISLCFLHTSIVILLLIRLLAEIKWRYAKRLVSLLVIAWVLLLPTIQGLLSKLPEGTFWDLLNTQVSIYTTREYSGVYNFIIKTIILVSMTTIVYRYRKLYRQYGEKVSLFYTFALYVIIFTIGSVGMYDIYVRMINFIILIFPVALMLGLNKISEEKENYLKRIGSNNLVIYTLTSVGFIAFIFFTRYQYMIINFGN